MERITGLFASGAIFAPILALICIEASVLLIAMARARIPRTVRVGLVVNLLAGAGLLTAALLVVAGMAWYWIATALGAALAAHVSDIRRRFGRRRSGWYYGSAL